MRGDLGSKQCKTQIVLTFMAQCEFSLARHLVTEASEDADRGYCPWVHPAP